MQKGKFRRVLAVFLSLIMISGMAFSGVPTFAEEAKSGYNEAIQETSHTKTATAESTGTEKEGSDVVVSTAETPSEITSEILEPSGDNPDHLDAPDSSPYAGKINYNIQPLTPFPALTALRKNLKRSVRANDPPVIGEDHPENPGDVMLFKQAEPVEGMVNTWEITLRVEGKDTVKTSDIVLVIDRSGSMGDYGRMTAAKAAARAFVDSLLPSTTTRIAVVSFAGEVTTNQVLTNDADALKNAINSLNASGGTFTQAGVRQAQAILDNSEADNRHIVLLSDGEPTYSYRIPDNTIRRNGYVLSGNVYYTGTGYASSAYGTTRVGSGNSITQYIEVYNGRYAYYHHGNSAIAEAGFAGSAGTNIFTVGLQTNATGSGVLEDMVQGSGTFTEVTDPAQLTPVFQAIAGQIGAAVKEAAVGDPMGPGFEIPAASVGSITTVPATPAASYDPVTKKITWNPGTLTTPIEPGSDIKYAELKYTIEINDDILEETPDENGEYPTNGNAQITYTDADGETQTGTFPVPMVNPVLYKIVKVLQDKDGNPKTANRNFTVKVTGPGSGGASTERTFTLNTNTPTGSRTKLMTDLRYASTYTFEETGDLSDYDVTYFVNGTEVSGAGREFTIENGTTADVEVKVVNKEKPVTVEVTKVWDDANDQDGLRPDSITVQLYADGTAVEGETLVLNEANSWTGTFSDLPMFNASDDPIAYTVDETEVPDGYTKAITGSMADGFTITNSHTPATTSVSVTKVWDDADDQDGLRPDSVTVQLYADGTAVDGKTLELNEDNSWTGTFSDLPVNKAGTAIAYTVDETAVPTGYTKAITGTAADGFTITNSHTPETTSKTVSKVWDDNDNQDGLRVDVTLQLVATVDGAEVDWATLKAASASGALMDDDGLVTLTGKVNESHTFDNLPVKYQGKEIVYTVLETTVPADYDESYDQETLTVTNAYTPETTSKTVSKVWDDNNNQDGLRVDVTLKLVATVEGAEVDWATLKAASASGALMDDDGLVTLTGKVNESHTFDNLPVKYQGKEIVYTVLETTVPAGYSESYDQETLTVTNTHIPGTISVSGTKTWDDKDDQDGMRPASITIKLYKKVGSADPVLVDTKTVTEADGWAWSFANLPEFEMGTKIVYSITEDAVAGYTTTIDGYNATNKHTPGKTSVQVTKVWDDEDNKDGSRPKSITVQLLADGVDTGKTLVLTADNNWKGTFTDLDEYKNKKKIVYSVNEKAVEGYTALIVEKDGQYVITNSHKPVPPPPTTGENMGSYSWMGMMLIAYGALMLIRRRRRAMD